MRFLHTPRSLLAAVVLGAIVFACSADSGPPCPAPGVVCGGACLDVANDRAHCGACGRACAAAELCVQGTCVPTCPVGQRACGGACVDPQQDRAHCGRCGNPCGSGEVCSAGVCGTDCGPLTTCGDIAADGRKTLYCANLALDRNNCGYCGGTCPLGNVCRGGRCELTCPLGQLNCGGRCVDPQTDRLHCGMCGAVCAMGFECARGRCTIGGCPAGTTLCAGSCVDLTRDRNHCGACLAQCPSGYLCSANECRFACAPGESMCGAGCADLMNDPRNCGACGRACGLGELCRAGACAVVCQPGQTLCAGRCTDVSRDRSHCGACGVACTGAQACVDGACREVCPAGQSRCGAFCYDLRSEPANCGECGRACAAGQACVEGSCRAVAVGPVMGACAAPSLTCGGVCTDVRNDNAHCGACDAACPGDRLCFNGTCVRPCLGAEVRCPSGACADTRFDALHCGRCGNVCPAGQFCVRGVCGTQGPPTRYTPMRDDPAVTFIDACAVPGVTRLLGPADEGEMVTTLPFPFRYWTTDYDAGAPVLLSVNGFFAFTGALSSVRSPFLPSTSAPNGMVAVHARDLENVEALCVATIGVAPLRRWVIEWARARERSGTTIATSELTFEAIVTERSETIDVVYRTMTGALSGYTGLETPTGTAGVSGCPTVGTSVTFFCAPPAGTSVRFTPSP
jgi:hypothetical protein